MQKLWQEPGRCDTFFGINNAKTEYFKSKEPNLVFGYRGSLGGKRGSRKARTFVCNLPTWGKAKDLWEKTWDVKLAD